MNDNINDYEAALTSNQGASNRQPGVPTEQQGGPNPLTNDLGAPGSTTKGAPGAPN